MLHNLLTQNNSGALATESSIQRSKALEQSGPARLTYRLGEVARLLGISRRTLERERSTRKEQHFPRTGKMSDKLRLVLTVGQIASRLDEPLHRIEYAIKSRNIKPVALAGHARIFEERVLERISPALLEMDARRENQASSRWESDGGDL